MFGSIPGAKYTASRLAAFVPEDLHRLRQSLREVDDRLQDNLRRRLEIARQIGLTKRERGLPLRDYGVEREVVDRWRLGLAPSGVTTVRSEAFARWLVEESIRVQDEVGESARRATSPSDVLVIGGAGRMGRWVGGFLSSVGHRVAISDPRAGTAHSPFPVKTDLARAVQDSAIVVVATPMRAAPPVFREIWKSETEAVVFDLLSLKAPIISSIRRGRDSGFHVASAHPLFGPDVRSLWGRNVVVVDCGDPFATRTVVQLFAHSSLNTSVIPLELHDKLMADALALPHVVSLLFGLTLGGSAANLETLGSVAPTSFFRQVDATRVVSHENPELSFDIQTLNPAMEPLFQRMEQALGTLRDAVRGQNPEAYERLLANVALTSDRVASRREPGGKPENPPAE